MAFTSANTAHTPRCLRCGRALTAARSVTNNYGPTCRRRVRDAARAQVAAQYKPHQVVKAEELIEQGALVPLRGRRVFLTVSTDGATTYRTHRAACTCPAGIKGAHPCKHRIAAHLVTAA